MFSLADPIYSIRYRTLIPCFSLNFISQSSFSFLPFPLYYKRWQESCQKKVPLMNRKSDENLKPFHWQENKRVLLKILKGPKKVPEKVIDEIKDASAPSPASAAFKTAFSIIKEKIQREK